MDSPSSVAGMDATPSATPNSRFQSLPVELLIQIMSHISDCPTLGGFLATIPQFGSIFDKYQGEILPSVLATSPTSQIGQLSVRVMTFRRAHPCRTHPDRLVLWPDAMAEKIKPALICRDATTPPSDDDSEDGFFGDHCDETPATDYEMSRLPFIGNPVPLLLDISEVAVGIEQILRSFAQRRILGPSAKLKRPLSSSEALRIRRALWRFQLCYELCHGEGAPCLKLQCMQRRDPTDFVKQEVASTTPQSTQSNDHLRLFAHHWDGLSELTTAAKQRWLFGHPDGFYRHDDTRPIHEQPKPVGHVHNFIQQLCIWEIEEIDAVRHHIAAEVNALQYRRCMGENVDLSAQPHLIQRIAHDLDHWHEAYLNPTDHILVAKWRLRNYLGQVSKHWPENGEANKSNTKHRSRMSARFQKMCGWCMWDESRLSDRGLLCEDIFEAEKTGLECIAAQQTPADQWVAAQWEKDIEVGRDKQGRKKPGALYKEEEDRADIVRFLNSREMI